MTNTIINNILKHKKTLEVRVFVLRIIKKLFLNLQNQKYSYKNRLIIINYILMYYSNTTNNMI